MRLHMNRDIAHCFFFCAPCSRITDVDECVSSCILFNLIWTVVGMVFQPWLNQKADQSCFSLWVMRRTVVTIASMFSYKYFDFNGIGVPCPISCDNGCMKAPRARIGADTVDPITSFVRGVNFELEIIENRRFFYRQDGVLASSCIGLQS